MPRKFLLGKAPFVRSVDEGKLTTTKMMYDIIIALTPIIIFAWVKNGLIPFIKIDNCSVWVLLYPLIFVLVGALSSALFEGLYFALFKKVRGFKNILREVNISYAIIPGILLALVLPLYTPIWVLMLGCFLANIVFKMLFGGFGHNIFNPALIAYAFLMLAFAGTLGNAYFNPYENSQILDSVASVTPLGNFANLQGSGAFITQDALIGSYGSLWDFFLGTIPGSLGETSALLCLVAFAYLVIRKTIDWYVPTIYVGTVFVITWIIGAVNGYTGIWYPLFHVLSGGLLFGAVFMATEPVTTPRNPLGKVIFSLGLGVLTVLFRFVGSLPEGVATSILFMCLFTPMIDRFAAKMRANKLNVKNAITLALILLIFVGIGGYAVAKTYIPQGGVLFNEAIKNNTLVADQDSVKLDHVGTVSDEEMGKVSYVAISYNADKKEVARLYYVETKGWQDGFKVLVAIDTNKDSRTYERLLGYEIVESNDTFLDKIVNMSFRGKKVTDASFTINTVSGATLSSTAVANAGYLARMQYHADLGIEVPIDYQLESIKQDLSDKANINKFNVVVTYGEKRFEVVLSMTDVEDKATLTASDDTLTAEEKSGIERVAKAGITTWIYTKEEANKVYAVGKGYAGTLKGYASFDENGVTEFVITDAHETSPNVEEQANETLPGLLVNAGSGFESQNIAGATVTSNGLKEMYRLIYRYVTGGNE